MLPRDVLRVLAVDTGPTSCGWAVLESGRDALGLARFVECGECASDKGALTDLVLATSPHFVAVETPAQVFPSSPKVMLARSKQVVATSRVAERLANIANAYAKPAIPRTVGEWRRALCGKGVRGTPNDAAVARVLPLYVVNRPARSNVHERDALGLGVVALWRPPPQPVVHIDGDDTHMRLGGSD